LQTLMTNDPAGAISTLEKMLKGTTPYPYRREGYRLLGERQESSAEKLLIEMLPLESVEQETLLDILGQKAQHLPQLLPFLSIYPVPVLKAILAFGILAEDEKAIPFMQHPQIKVRILALQVVAKLQVERSSTLLMQQLQDPSWILRRQILQLIRSKKIAGSFNEILPYFYQDPANQSIILEILLSFPEGRELATIKKLLEVQNPELTQKAFLQLQHQSLSPPEAWLEFLFSQMNSPALILSSLPLLESLPLTPWLETHPAPLEQLKQILRSAPTLLQEELLCLLGKAKAQVLKNEVLAFLNHSSVALQRSAISTLGKWENSENLPILLEKIQEENLQEELRDEIALALLRIQKQR
ncbi:MAG: hypothetical protein AABZ60_04965, partial [Planctomycetota bacterium]